MSKYTPPKVWVATVADAIIYGTEFCERYGFGGEIEPDNDGTGQTDAVLAQRPPTNVLGLTR